MGLGNTIEATLHWPHPRLCHQEDFGSREYISRINIQNYTITKHLSIHPSSDLQGIHPGPSDRHTIQSQTGSVEPERGNMCDWGSNLGPSRCYPPAIHAQVTFLASLKKKKKVHTGWFQGLPLTTVHRVVLVYSCFNDLVIALSLVIEMTAMHYYTNLMVCNYSS